MNLFLAPDGWAAASCRIRERQPAVFYLHFAMANVEELQLALQLLSSRTLELENLIRRIWRVGK